MTSAYLPACNRVFLKIQFAITALLLIMLGAFVDQASAQQAPATGPKIWLQDNQPLGVHQVGVAAGAGAQPVSMATGDIDGDDINDMVVGYSAAGGGFVSVHHGNLDAFAPQSDASLQAVANGQFPAPFLPDAQTFSVPVTPDFLALGNFTGDGQRDLILAARGSNTLYVFPGDGHGGFGTAQTVGVPGGVTSLATGDFGPSAQFGTVLIGVTGVGKSFSLIVMGGS